MIQPKYPFAQSTDDSVTVFNSSHAGGGNAGETGDEAAYRIWLTRREAARTQIRRLSRRELQVVTLVASGLANKSIAQELEISVKTIEKHRANAARKLGVGSTAELVRLSVLADQDSTPGRERSAKNAPASRQLPTGSTSENLQN